MFKPINRKNSPELLPQPGLEYWFRERRTIVDFRRGPLGPHFDGFATYLKAKGYSQNWGSRTLAKCCLFNAFLIDQGITKCEELSESLIDSFLDVYFENFRTTGAYYATRTNARGMLKRLFLYLIETHAIEQPKPKPIKKPYSWILEPYLRYLRDECELSETKSCFPDWESQKVLSILRFSPVYAHRFFGFAPRGPLLSPRVATQRHGGLGVGSRA